MRDGGEEEEQRKQDVRSVNIRWGGSDVGARMNEQVIESTLPIIQLSFFVSLVPPFSSAPLHPKVTQSEDCESGYLSLHPQLPPPLPLVLHLQQKESEGKKREGQGFF